MTQFQAEIAEWVLNFAFWTSLAFPVAVSFFWPWKDSWWGRNIVILELLIAFALVPAMLRVDFGLTHFDPVLLGWITIMSVGLIPVVVIHRTYLIWRAQSRDIEVTPVRHADEEAPTA